MAAYVVVELEVRDQAAKDRYSKAAGPTIKEFGGELIAAGNWTQLAGATGLKNGAIFRFESPERALAWYNSPSYQSTIADREAGMVSRFQLIG